MKKCFFLLFTACICSIGKAAADNILTISDVDVPQGGKATVEVGCEFDTDYTAFELQIVLPEGLSLLADEDGYPVIEKAFDSNHVLTGNLLPSNGNYKVTCRSMDNISMPNSGILFRVTIQADAGLALGANLAARITACEFTRTADSNGESLADVDFAVNITEFRTILDEGSTVPPVDEANANVLVRRTITAGKWSSICLPFEMTADQVKDVFGNGVLLADFTSWSSEENEDGAIVGINVGFTTVTAIEANHPYIIKVVSDVADFSLDGVNIMVSDEPKVQVGKKSSERGYFYGTYVSMKVPEENVFLRDNKFWYSVGNTTTMGYRGYFEFKDVLDAYYDMASVKYNFFLDGVETRINSMEDENMRNGEKELYNLSGQRLTHIQRGVNIINGKKIVKR